MNIVLLGAPGSGKGTASSFLIQEKNYHHLSTGDALRAICKKDSPLGHEICALLEKGQLVSDELVNQIVKETIASLPTGKSIIFDGYPRTVAQAEYLQTIINIDKVILVDISDEKIIHRVTTRRICKQNGHPYSVSCKEMMPKCDGVCDIDGSELVQRKDDNEQTARERLAVYHSQIDPLIKFYKSLNILDEVDADVSVAKFKEEILKLA